MKIKKNYFKLAGLILLIIFCSIFFVEKVGVKDGFTASLSLILTLYIIISSKKNIKKSLCIFIISMPILVTARKVLYLDFFLLKVNFESIIILWLFISNYKKIKATVDKFINKNKYFMYLIILFIVSAYISCIFSNDLKNSVELVTTSVLIPVMIGALAITYFEKKDIKFIIYSLIISVNLSCLYGIVQILGDGLNLHNIIKSRGLITFGYHNVNIFVNIALMVFPLLLNELLYKKNNLKEKVFLIISGLLQSGCIFITFSRGAWLSLGLVIFLILFSKKYKYLFLVIIVSATLISPIALPKILGRGDSSVHFLQNTSNTARVLSIVVSKDSIKDNIFGVGYGRFNEIYRETADDAYMSLDYNIRKNMLTPLYSLEHAHNFFLNIGVELGLFSLISIVLIFIYGIINCLKNYKFNRGIFTSLILFIFIGVTTGIELNHKGVLTNTYILWLLFSIIIINNSKIEEEN